MPRGSSFLSTYEGSFYKVNLKDKRLLLLEKIEIQKNYLRFYKFWNKVNSKKIIVLNSNEFSAIIEENNKLEVFDMKNMSNKISINKPKIEFHDVISVSSFVAFISEDEILLIRSDGKEYKLKTEEGSSFLRAGIIIKDSNLELVILKSNNSNCCDSTIEIYKVL